MEKQNTIWTKVREYLLITLGVELVVMGVYFFKFPNNFSIGGVTGLAILLSKVLGPAISSGTIVLIINLILLVVGYIFLGKSFGNRTAYGSILMSLSLSLLEVIVPMKGPLTQEPMLELAFAVILPAVGAATLFNIGASTGGTDVIAVLLKKYTNTDIGRSLLYSDLILTMFSFLVFDVQTGLLSMLGLLLKTTLVDTVIESLNLNKYFTIICETPKPICNYITNNLHRSATILDGKGAFSDRERKIILTVMNRSQAVQLRRFIKQAEPEAFILITNTSEIVGRGFRA
ncbi:YitT family protein [Anaerocolumna sp. AGMB13025]|uniref:YitT family protein n=1 Tax=Anaerocolumna sp. AGMB13025 TaxID=3039116 RepID=UPI00241C3FB7|nr:YitT family protein [Anaerocolumna sp. AGMB13025]WFR57002.1 YitT family protein [Anaerocolumna sp. AGMB13025]